MLKSEFDSLEDGAKVVFTGTKEMSLQDSLPAPGTVITREKTWLCDDHSIRFNYVNEAGESDYHFFVADEVELVKE